MKIFSNKKTLTIMISIVSLIIVALLVIFIIKLIDNNKIKDELISVTTKYYDEEFVEVMPTLLKRNGKLDITLESLKELNKDISYFEDLNCNLKDTYVTLKYNENDKYDVEAHINCD